MAPCLFVTKSSPPSGGGLRKMNDEHAGSAVAAVLSALKSPLQKVIYGMSSAQLLSYLLSECVCALDDFN